MNRSWYVNWLLDLKPRYPHKYNLVQDNSTTTKERNQPQLEASVEFQHVSDGPTVIIIGRGCDYQHLAAKMKPSSDEQKGRFIFGSWHLEDTALSTYKPAAPAPYKGKTFANYFPTSIPLGL